MRPAALPTTLPTTVPTTGQAEGYLVPTVWPDVRAVAAPPSGWKAEPLKASDRHQHQVWLSPTGDTAYGIIHFRMPLPVSADFVLPFFLRTMKQDQGEAKLLSRSKDPTLPGVRFAAEGGLYRLNANLITSGLHGWTTYAGTLRDRPVNEAELALAIEAREATRVGLPEGYDEN